MTAEAQPATEAQPEALRPSQIILTFGPDGSADCVIHAHQVTPGQLYAGAFLLECAARERRVQQSIEQASAAAGQAAPPDLVDLLRQLGLHGA